MANKGFSCFGTCKLPSPRVAETLWQLASKGMNVISTSALKNTKNSTQHRGGVLQSRHKFL